jgi:hypothetical protein
MFCFLLWCLKEKKKIKNKLKNFFNKEEESDYPHWMGHPDVDEGLLPLASLTVDDVLHPGEGEWYLHSRTGEILKCTDEMMEARKRQKEKRIVEEKMAQEAKELRKTELREESREKYGSKK